MRVEGIEQWLDSHGAAYKLRTIDLSEIDRESSHRNQARISEPINEDTAILYASAMAAGDQFPPVVVAPITKGFVVIDGNHRVAAYDLNDTKRSDAYVLNGLSDAQRAALTFEANTKHGLPTSLQERLRQAIYLVELGTSHVEAARMLGLPLTRVRNAANLHSTDKRLQGLGVLRWDRLPITARGRLAALSNDKVLKAAAALAVEAKMSGTDIEALIVRVNSSKSDVDKQLAIVEEEKAARKEDIRVTAGGRLGWSRPAMKLSSVLTSVVRLDPNIIKADSIGEDMRKRLKSRTIEAVNRLSKVAEVL